MSTKPGAGQTDLFDQSQPAVDWVKQITDEDAAATKLARSHRFERIVARGSCDLGAVLHYFAATTRIVSGEYFFFRNGLGIRIEHSAFLRHAINRLSADQLAVAEQLGYGKEDFVSEIFSSNNNQSIVLLSFGADPYHALYRHRRTGLEVPFSIPEWNPGLDIRLRGVADPPTQNGLWTRALHFLGGEFDYLGLIQEQAFKENLSLALRNISPASQVFIIERLESYPEERDIPKRFAAINQWTREACKSFPNVQTLSTDSFIETHSEIINPDHFDRKVYFRIYQAICDRIN